MFIQAFDYKSWSDIRLLDAIQHVEQSESLAFLCQQLNHTVIVQDLFQSRLLGTEPPHPATNSELVPDYSDLRERLMQSDDWYRGFVGALNLDTEQQIYRFTFADGKQGAMTCPEILFHIIHHGAYHRGSMAHALDLAGVEHPADSFTIYLHQAEPQRRDS